jgi:putative flippase GtrA
LIASQFLRFAGIGALGFFVDAGVLTLAHGAGLGLYLSRAFSFLSAVTFTWLCNRRYTFFKEAQSPPTLREWARFAATNAVGGAVNLLTYAVLVSMIDLFAERPVLAVGVGSVAGLLFNFLGSRAFVFPGDRKLARPGR